MKVQITVTEVTYYRTRFGSKAHASSFCANARRAIGSGDILPIPAAELKDWAPCKHCTAPELRAAWGTAPKAEKPAKAMCANNGVKNPRQIYSDCKSCGKNGKVNRSTGALRAHAPAH
jgi:hypothetical protein